MNYAEMARGRRWGTRVRRLIRCELYAILTPPGVELFSTTWCRPLAHSLHRYRAEVFRRIVQVERDDGESITISRIDARLVLADYLVRVGPPLAAGLRADAEARP